MALVTSSEIISKQSSSEQAMLYGAMNLRNQRRASDTDSGSGYSVIAPSGSCCPLDVPWPSVTSSIRAYSLPVPSQSRQRRLDVARVRSLATEDASDVRELTRFQPLPRHARHYKRLSPSGR